MQMYMYLNLVYVNEYVREKPHTFLCWYEIVHVYLLAVQNVAFLGVLLAISESTF